MKYLLLFIFAIAAGALPAAAQTPSSANRVVVISGYASSKWAQNIVNKFNDRFNEHLKNIGGFTMVPLSGHNARTLTTEDVQDLCKRNNANAVITPFTYLDATESRALAVIGLEVEDCYGIPYYAGSKSKTESRQWVRTELDREFTDMGNDLMDQLLADFQAYRTSHIAAWNNLMQTGMPVDPAAPESRIYVGVSWDEQTGYFIRHVRPGALGAKAGLQTDDVLVSIEGAPIDDKKSTFEVTQQLDRAQNVTVKRNGKDVTVILRQVAGHRNP